MDPELIRQIADEVKKSLRDDSSRDSYTRIAENQAREEFIKKVFVTADDLRTRIQSGTSSSVDLASNEFLTPAARDLASRRKITITNSPDPRETALPRPVPIQKTIPTSSDVPLSATRKGIGPGPVGLVLYLPDAKTESVLRALAHDGIFFTDYTRGECWMDNLLALCRGIVEKEIVLGVALFPYGADAMIMANKTRGIRAVQGTLVDSVAASIRRLDTNLLILEHRLSTFHQLRSITRFFVQNRMVSGLADDVLGRIEIVEKR